MIKSLEELKQIREQHKNKTILRHGSENLDNISGDFIEILVGMGTCGIASGARETLKEIVEELSANKIENTRVIPVGCIGSCKSEPIIQVNIPGSKPVFYGNVKKEKVKEIITGHIINKKQVDSLIIHPNSFFI